MKSIAIIFIVIVIVEALVEYGTTIYNMVESKAYKKAVKQFCAIAVCLFFCFQCNADIFAYCGLTFAVPWLGIVLTGIFGSRGSNYVADLLKRLQALGNTTELTTVNEYLSNGAQPAQDTDSATEAG